LSPHPRRERYHTTAQGLSALMSRSVGRSSHRADRGYAGCRIRASENPYIPGTWVNTREPLLRTTGYTALPAAHHYLHCAYATRMGHLADGTGFSVQSALSPRYISSGPEAFPSAALAFAPKARPRCGQLTCPPMRITPSRMAKPCCSATAHWGRSALLGLKTSCTPRLRRRSRPWLREIACDGAPL
jgi:hypothetical protein